MPASGRFGPLIGAIDEGTSSARFLVFAASTGEVLTYHQVEVLQQFPHEGWVEQDPLEILEAVTECVARSVENLRQLDIDPADIKAVGITNQRETTILWDPHTGKPLANAIVWLDVRTTDTVDQMLAKVKDRNLDYLKPLCGLPVSTYFSALKVRWLMDNVPGVTAAMDEGRCLFGTVDSWLIWNFTGGKDGGLHITDVTNASRTMLMNVKSLKWDPTLCRFFDIPMHVLPEIRSSSEIYGYITEGPLQGIPISGCLGDQQSALVGQLCFKRGQAKTTYGTGGFMLYNTGTMAIQSNHGMLTTVAYRLGKDAPPVYALEGSIAICGAIMKWLRDNLGVLRDVTDSEKVVEESSVKTDGKVYFVPAFSGLYAPYWRKDARSCIVGITDQTTSGDVVMAAMEAVCFQTRDIIEAMNTDCGVPLRQLLVDGGMTANNSLMQLQADLCGFEVVRPLMTETTALGAAMAAGSAEGIGVWDLSQVHSAPADTFYPAITEDERDIRYSRWKMAIKRSFGWVPDPSTEETTERNKDLSILSSVPVTVFMISAFAVLLVAKKMMG
ncbi:glycerol kinase 3-like [Bacillus rossius redtenbacheri]|uniref:glycerol kinase 3-like n=1 Tax=Bacillus rossius redtenbacheri TaxID=93214 RepID=UPI002FDD0BCB